MSSCSPRFRRKASSSAPRSPSSGPTPRRRLRRSSRAAEAKAAELEQQALSDARRKAEAEGRKLQERHDGLEADFAEKKANYERAEAALRAKVEDLNATREALVTGLEAIAKGGLSGLAEVEALLEPASVNGNGNGNGSVPTDE